MTRSSLIRENDVIVYFIKERRLTNEINVTCTLTLLNSEGSWIFLYFYFF